MTMELIGSARNFSLAIDTEHGTVTPMAEVVLIVAEPAFHVDAGGQLVKERQTQTLRFAVSVAGLRRVAKEMEHWAKDLAEIASRVKIETPAEARP